MDLSVVVVSYRSASLAAAAIADYRAQAEEAGWNLEVLAVVNSGEAAEASALESCADRVFLPDRNLGYAGGLNLGLAAASGDVLLLSNPDIRLLPGALAELVLATLGIGFGAVGPVFYLDRERHILVPPFEEPHPFGLARRRAAREPRRAGGLLRRDLPRALALARAAARGDRIELSALPGALLALTPETLERVGPFDEAYALYYEENDWERRLRRLGGRLVVAGGAHVLHRYGSTTRGEPKAAAWFAESERRYFLSHFGRWGDLALQALSRSGPWPLPAPPALPDATIRWEPRAGDAAVLASTLPEFRPFALAEVPRGASSWRPPESFLREIAADEPWYVRAVALPSGETLAEGRIDRRLLRPAAGA